VTLSGTDITYTPATDFFGFDTFYYIVSDGELGGTSIGSATVFVRGPGALITGLIQLDRLVGVDPGDGFPVAHVPVTFKASTNDDLGNKYIIWKQTITVDFLNTAFDGLANTNTSVAAYTLSGVPEEATFISAKTDWNLRRRLPVVIAGGLGSVDFIDASLLPGGDYNLVSNPANNFVDLGDLIVLGDRWYITDPAADINQSGFNDLGDLIIMGDNWYTGGDESTFEENGALDVFDVSP
jgi:hypothetical protein